MCYKKHNECAVIILEEADSSDTNDNNTAINIEGNATISNYQKSFESLDSPMLFCCDARKTVSSDNIYDVSQNKFDEEVNAKITNEWHCTLKNKSDEGSMSKTQDLEHSEEMEYNNNSETNDSNRDHLGENI